LNDVTSYQLKTISEYVRFAEGLPTELAAVKVYLGYDASSDPALSPHNMQILFQEIRDHADLWKETIATRAREQLRELSITAVKVVKNGSGLLRGLKALGSVEKILNTVGNASISPDVFNGSNVTLDEATMTHLNQLKPYVDTLQSTTLDSLGDTHATNQLIADFRSKTAVLEARVAGQVTNLKSDHDDQLGKEKTVEPVIDAFREACARIVAQFGEGSEVAVAIQQQVDNTLAELTSREPELRDQQRLTYAVGRLFVHLQSLGYSMLGVQSELTHLWFASSSACSKLAYATAELESVTTEKNLLEFYISYEEVLRNWTSVRQEASDLYNLF